VTCLAVCCGAGVGVGLCSFLITVWRVFRLVVSVDFDWWPVAFERLFGILAVWKNRFGVVGSEALWKPCLAGVGWGR
jgi:hypothetical protein